MQNNISDEYANLRDTFFAAEMDYVRTLLQIEGIKELIIKYSNYSNDALFREAQEIVNNVDNELIPQEQMERAEQALTILFAAIQDKTLLKDLVLTPDFAESHSKSR